MSHTASQNGEAKAEVGLALSDERANHARLAWLLVALTMLAVVLLCSVAVGSKGIALGNVLKALLAYDGSADHAVIESLRLPRTLLGLIVGVALGMSGALIQALTRNPLADPGILGVNAGAAFCVMLATGVFGVFSIQIHIWFAFLGAVITTFLVYAVSALGKAGATPLRLILAGVAIGALFHGISSGVALLDPERFDRMRRWSAGSIATSGFDASIAIAPFVLLGLVLALFVVRPLNAIALGDHLASALGASIMRTQAIAVVAVTLLAGSATAAAGPIGFIGLMVPHVARWVAGPDQRWIFAYTIVLSPILLLAADIVGRLVMRPGELQVGIVTAFIGAPVLILLARRHIMSRL